MKIKHNLYFAPVALFVLLMFVQPLYAQTCRNDITPTTPTQDFTLHDDGTVTHHKTGLMWMRCALGQSWDGTGCTGRGQPLAWANALQAADSFNFAGHSDWRLPNFKELASIVEQACIDPAINATVFPATLSSSYLSSSDASGGGGMWGVNFNRGGDQVNLKTIFGYRIRLVRDGQ